MVTNLIRWKWFSILSLKIPMHLLEALRERAACLLQNHGVLAVGPNLQRAHLCAVYVEDAAKICTLAEIHGPLKPLDEETVRKIRES